MPLDTKQEYATFTYYPRIEQTGAANGSSTTAEAGVAGVSGGFGRGAERSTQGFSLQAANAPILRKVKAGHYEDLEMPCTFEPHPQMNVRVGVVENLTGSNDRKQRGTLQVLDEELISGNKILVLRPARLGMLCELEELTWPCTAHVIMNHNTVST